MKMYVIEGPNGVGKTTLCRLIIQRLSEMKIAHGSVTEPSATDLGRLIRSKEAQITGRALALAVAADRHQQYDVTIAPLLANESVVVSDRYVPSSLVLQRIDGLSMEEVWLYNQYMPAPESVFYLYDEPDVIQARLSARASQLSRLEKKGSAKLELELYQNAYDFLDVRGWQQKRLNCHGLTPDEICDQVMDEVLQSCTMDR